MSTSRYVREATKQLAPRPAVTAISGLLRWFKADDLALADNSLVSTWPDRSGNGGDLTASGGLRPMLVQGRLDGKPSIVFSGGQRLDAVALDYPTTDVTVFVVAANFKHNSNSMFLSWGKGTTQGFNLFGDSSADANKEPPALIALKSGGIWANNLAVATACPFRGDPTILTGYTNGATTKIRVDKGNEISDSGDSGNLDFTTGGSGSVTLALGDKGSLAGPMRCEIFEVLIYNRTLNSTEIGIVEDYLDQKWRVTQDHASFLALYNGESAAGNDYQLGLTFSADGKRWKRYLSNPVYSKSGSGWERDLVKDPSAVSDGSQYILYYSGLTTATNRFQIGRATSTDLVTWTRDTHNPVVALGGGGSVDEHGCLFPTVIYDLDEADPTRRWKMWYAAIDASGKETVSYAYSTDGVSWTKYGKVLDVGAGGAWDAIGVIPGCLFKASGTWYLFYGGRSSSSGNARWSGGVATFTNPESTYTKYGLNPTLLARYHDTGTSEALTSDTLIGSRTVVVASTAGFNLHEPVFMDRVAAATATVAPQINRILTIDSSTQITLERPVVENYPTSDNARIVSAAYNSIIPRAIRQLEDGTFELHTVPFQPADDVSHSPNNSEILREMSWRSTLATLTSQAALDYQSGLSMIIGDPGSWDELSSENFASVLVSLPGRFAVVPFISSRTVVYTPTIQGTEVHPSFIASVTQVYTPTLISLVVTPSFISSVTAVHAPTISSTQVLADFIDTNTIVYPPDLYVPPFTGGAVSQVALEVLTSDGSPNAQVSQVTLEIIVPWYDGLHVWEKSGQTGG